MKTLAWDLSASTVVWLAWRGSNLVATEEFPATMSGCEVRDVFCDRGLNDGTLRVTLARPVVGMLATVDSGTDSYPYDVIKVSPTGAKVELRARAYRGPLTIEDLDGKTTIAWRDGAGDYRDRYGNRVSFGAAELYLDPTF